jgi:cyclophilin family peptidyl-prolyl cis-trans isomerase
MSKLIPVLSALFLAVFFNAKASPPTILSEPQSLTVNNASTATFTVVADTNALTYQWQFNGAAIAGATNASLYLDDVATIQAGSYTVVVSSIDTSVTSAPPAVLTLVPGTIVRFIFSGLLTGTTNYADVELFNHDKPITVRNFIQYITSGAYSNMFIDRCVTGFVIQGGSFATEDRTNTTPPVTGHQVSDLADEGIDEPPFPQEIVNEFGYGPLIHNEFGTISMALGASTNSASASFFFNLADNSNPLDAEDFTVFGRVLTMNGALQYFNGLTLDDGLENNGEFYDILGGETFAFPNPPQPVNYVGSSAPANTNVVFCDFQILNVDISSPTMSITSPPSGESITNGTDVLVQGTASASLGVEWVRAELIPVAASDGSLPNFGVSVTNYTVGTNNWSISMENSYDFYGLFPPGQYTLEVEVQDEAGNMTQQSQPLTITPYLIVGNGSINVTSNGVPIVNPIGYPYQIGEINVLVPVAATNNLFLNWSVGSVSSISQQLEYEITDGQTLTATFISNDIPTNLSVSYPPASATVDTATFNVTGTISGVPSAQVTCQIYSQFTLLNVTPPLVTTGTTNWSVTVTNLANGAYILLVMAVDPAGQSTAMSEYFTVGSVTTLSLNIVGDGTVTPVTNGESIEIGTGFQVTAKAKAGYKFYSWSDGTTISLNPVQTYTMSSGLTLTATFVPNVVAKGISITYPAAGARLTNGNFLISGRVLSAAKPVQISAQVFSATTETSVGAPLTASGSTTWSSTNETQLAPGQYILDATAVDANGRTSLISQKFSVLAPIHIITDGLGGIAPLHNGEYLVVGTAYSVRATPKPGQLFYTWSDGSTVTINPVRTFTMIASTNYTLTATFISNSIPRGISFTSPVANARVTTNNIVVTGKIESGLVVTQITCEVFSQSGVVKPIETATITGITWSAPFTNMTPGQYTLVAIAYDSQGRTTLISEKFTVNFFAGVAGTYTGLFLNVIGPVANTNSGYVTLQVAASGAFSGRVVFPAYGAVGMAYSFDPAGEVELSAPDFHGSPLLLEFSLDLTNGADSVTGVISSSNYWYSLVTCYRVGTPVNSSNALTAGKYILSLQPTNTSMGDGFATVTAGSGGAMTYSGALPDNSTFLGSARVSKDGYWPIYVTPSGYGTKGMLMGWEANTAPAGIKGQLYWFKNPEIGDSGTNNLLVTSIGTNVSRPAAGSYSVTFGGGDLTSPQTTTITANANGQFVPGSLTMTVSPAGVLTGHIANPSGKGLLQFKGAFMGPTQNGSGFTVAPDGSKGYFDLTPQAE